MDSPDHYLWMDEDLRKLIKHEESLGINVKKEDYFDSLFRRTTESFRAKNDKENARGQMNDITSRIERRSTAAKPLGNRKVPSLKHLEISDRDQGTYPRQKVQSSRASDEYRTESDSEYTMSKSSQRSNSGLDGITRKLNGILIDSTNSRHKTKDTMRTQAWAESIRAYTGNSGVDKATSYSVKEKVGSNLQSDKLHSRSEVVLERNDAETVFSERSTAPTRRKREKCFSKRTAGSPTNNYRSKSTMIPQRDLKTRKRKPTASDPVALYHYYQCEWKHFRNQIPQENNHHGLRWRIRQKLLNPDVITNPN